MKTRIVLSALLALVLTAPLVAAVPEVVIESPRGGYISEPIVTISGTVKNASDKFATLVYNGVSQRVAVSENGSFSAKMVLSHGDALVEVQARNSDGIGRDRVSFYANVEKVAMKVVLVWDSNGTDMDLWVTGPDGEKVFYANKTGKAGGQLDIDVTTGYGPETFTCKTPQAGTWQIQIQNFTPGKSPVTRMRVDLILFEGTDRELRRSYSVVAFRESEVISVVSFAITPGMEFRIR